MQEIAASWDDYRLALAVARARGLKGAALDLGVDPSTVFRRLAALERTLGTRVFERLAQGYRPTAAGARLVAAAERMETETAALDRALTGREPRLAGQLGIAAGSDIAAPILVPMIAAFRRRQPALAIVLTVEDRTAPPIGREIDIAFAAAPIEPRGFHCRKLGEVAWAVYGAAAYLDTHPAPRRIQELGDQALIAWTAGGGPAGLRRWLRALGAEDAAVFRTDSLAAQLAAAQAGLGLAVLPCCLADGVPGLRRVFEPVKALTRPLWAATAQELRRVTRVSAFLAAAAAFIAGQRRRLAGDNVPPPAPPDRPFGP